MALNGHTTPWGEPMPAHARAHGVRPGEWVYHLTFGLGEVLTCESRDGQDRAEVRFLRSHVRLLALAVAPMCRAPAGFRVSIPATVAPTLPPAQVAESPPASPASVVGVRQRLLRREGEPICGPPARAVLPCMPASPTWTMDTGLVGPFDPAWAAFESRGSFKARRERRAMTGLAHGQPRFVCAAPPPLAQLRNVLANMANDLMDQCRYKSFERRLHRCWPRRWDRPMLFDLSRPVSEPVDSQGVARLLDNIGGTARRVIQRLRARALANGRWWPAPQRLELWVHPNGAATARMRFAPGYQPPGQPWIEMSASPRVEVVTTPVPALQPASPLPRTDKEHRIQWRLNNGERLGPRVASLPLPWQTAPTLCGPFLYSPNGDAVDRALRRQARRRNDALPGTWAPRLVRGVVPPFKHLRGPLAEAVKAIEAADAAVLADVLERQVAQADLRECVIELAEPVLDTLYRPTTRQFLNGLRQRMVAAIQQRRAASHANGGWWPAPECLQVLVHADGAVTARMRFAPGYQRPGQPWLEWAGSRRRPTGPKAGIVAAIKAAGL